MTDRRKTILFICTHNRCRSILCEALANHHGGSSLRAFSAGSAPAGAVHPATLRHLEARAIDTGGLASQSWEDFEDLDPDAVVTVCDSAAAESCPLRMGSAGRVHWGLPDPSRVEGSPAEIDAAFAAVIATIEHRLGRLLALGPEKMDRAAFLAALESLAEEGA